MTIVNIVLLTALCTIIMVSLIGFFTYIGVSVVKLNKNVSNLKNDNIKFINETDEIYRNISQNSEEIMTEMSKIRDYLDKNISENSEEITKLRNKINSNYDKLFSMIADK
jgi:uncharacterized coiled-coil DUF342 family protein